MVYETNLKYILIDFVLFYLLSAIFIQDIHIDAIFHGSYTNLTAPLYPDNRTAILVSGQLRTGNLTWNQVKYFKERRWFGVDDPDTPIQTVVEWLIVPYALYGGVDMFIYIQVDRNHTNANGNKPIDSSLMPLFTKFAVCL
jgi:hypothetical protein